MAKVDYRALSRPMRSEHRQELVETFRRLGLDDEGLSLMMDMITESEKTMFARRIQIARRLIAGQSFKDIARELRVAHRTIQVVDQWLEGEFEAYRSIIPPYLEDRVKETVRNGKLQGHWKMLGHPSTLRWVKKQYPKRASLFEVLMRYPRVYPRARASQSRE